MPNPTSASSTPTALRVGHEIPFGSNEIRLTPRQWSVAGILICVLLYALPRVWEKLEPLERTPDARVPYALGNDYWNYDRTCREVAAPDKTLLVGDSVIWGHYVTGSQTLSHQLNALVGQERFANLGLDGVHPAALCGLLEYYGRALTGQRVLLNCNPLWISSARHDLSTDKEFAFNHPGLVPQFSPAIPCYRAPLSDKLGIVVSRQTKFLNWADHVRILYFGGSDLAAWSFEHPYEFPLAQITLRLPPSEDLPSPAPDARPWNAKGILKYTPEWVELSRSTQWQFFQRTVQLLQSRGNRVFVLVGPYNEHMLTPAGLRVYTERKGQIGAWLTQQGIPNYVPPALPSEFNADASHPTADGYRLLAQWLRDEPAFRDFLSDQKP